MSLNYSLSKIDKYEELIENDKIKQPYESIILSTIIIGMGKITKNNYEKFYNRISLIERINGAFLWDGMKPCYIQEEDIKRMIGLKVNVSNQTKSKFLNTIKRMLPTEL